MYILKTSAMKKYLPLPDFLYSIFVTLDGFRSLVQNVILDRGNLSELKIHF
uniref:Uncharacterized protein n=1 Tax=Anguilla anguilla TaxID=7936 RepID=A0A0E9SG67_ANGAN